MKELMLTWQEVLINKGYSQSLAKSFIGFIAWEEGKNFSKLGKEITDVTTGYEGRILAKDVNNKEHNSKGILFLSNDISDKIADKVFEVILDYEHKEVYDTKDVSH